MARTKKAAQAAKADKAAAAPAKAVSSVKEGRVTKPAQTPKSKSKEIAKTAAKATEKKDKKKKKKTKEPTPPPVSESEESSSESESEVEKEVEVPQQKTNGVADKAHADDSSESSESEDESEVETSAAKAAPGVNGVAKANGFAANSDSSASESESEFGSDESDSDAEPSLQKAGALKDDSSDESDSDESGSDAGDAQVKAEPTKTGAEASSDEDSDGSEGDSDESESDQEEQASKKRKAEVETTPVAKKTKTESNEQATGNLFVGNLSWNVDEEWLAREFEDFGEIVGCRIISDRSTGRSKGFGYVEFANPADAAKALEANAGKEVDGRALNVDFSTPRTENKQRETPRQRADRFADQKSPPSDTLFIGNISFNATSSDLQDAFEQFGTVTRVSLPTDPESGSLKGFGYVGFSSIDEAKAALDAMTGAEIAGRSIRLDFAGARPEGSRGGFGGGRGDRGGRGRGRGFGGFGGRGDRGGRGGGRGGPRGGRGSSTNRGGFNDFKGTKMSFD